MDRNTTVAFVVIVILFILGVLIYGSATDPDFWDAFTGKVKTECPEGTYIIGKDDAGNVICHKEGE